MSSIGFSTVYNEKFGETIAENFKELLDKHLYVDLVFICQNNVKMGAHQMVMSLMSKFFYDMFIENGNTTREKTIHVYVPDIRPKIMKHILEFVYCGKARLSRAELPEFNEDIKLLGMPLDVFSSASGVNAADKNPRTVNPSNIIAPQPVPNVINPFNTTATSDGNSNIVNSSNILAPQSVSNVTNPFNTKATTDVNTSNILAPQRVSNVLNPFKRSATVQKTSIVTATSTSQLAVTAVGFNVPPESVTGYQSESIVSSSNISVPVTPTVSTKQNQTTTPDLPVIVNSQSLSKVHVPNTEPSSSAENNPNVGIRDSPGSSIPSQNGTHLNDTAPRNKKRKRNKLNESVSICLDSDDDDVIPL